MKNIGHQIVAVEITRNGSIRWKCLERSMRNRNETVCNNKLRNFALFCFYLAFLAGAAAVFHLFHLLAQVALTAAVLLGLVAILAKVLGYIRFIGLVISPYTQVHQHLGKQRDKYYYGDKALHWLQS